MFASYPLVKNRSAFSTRRGVSSNPSRSGFSPISANSLRITSCICLLYICISVGPAVSQTIETPDALYADRANLASARKAADMWAAALVTNPKNFDAAWKLARADYWLGGHAAHAEQRKFYE